MMNGKTFWAGVLASAGVFFVGSLAAKQMHKYENYHVFYLPDGTTVESFEPEPSEIAETLQMKRWHFRATLPPNGDADCFRYGLEVSKKGTSLGRDHGNLYAAIGRTMDVWVCLIPEQGNWKSAKTITGWASSNFPPHSTVTMDSPITYDNPFYQQKDGEEISPSGSLSRRPTNSITLMRIPKPYETGRITPEWEAKPDTASIVLKIKSVSSMKQFNMKIEPPEELNRPFWTVWLHWFD